MSQTASTVTLFFIAISETRITKNKAPINHIDLTNYSYQHCPTESSAGGTLLYIRNHLSYKTRNDLNIYKSAELESTFIEIINHKKSNIIGGCIYRHPAMDLNEFNDYYFNELLHKLSSENKSATKSDHLPQFIILPNIFSNPPSNKKNIHERDWSNLVQENFILDYFSVDWNSLINNDKDVNLSFNIFLKRINAILDKHA